MPLYFQSESIDSKRAQLEVSEQYSRDHKEQHKISVANDWQNTFHIKWSISKNLNHQHSIHFLTTFLLPHDIFPRKSSSEAAAVFVLRIHRCLGLEKPLDDLVVAVPGCAMQRCPASGATAQGPSPAGRTQRNRREEKLWENFGTSKVEVLEIAATENPLKEE